MQAIHVSRKHRERFGQMSAQASTVRVANIDPAANSSCWGSWWPRAIQKRLAEQRARGMQRRAMDGEAIGNRFELRGSKQRSQRQIGAVNLCCPLERIANIVPSEAAVRSAEESFAEETPSNSSGPEG